MAENKTTQVVIEELNPALEKAKGFWAKYNKTIIVAGLAVILLGGGWLAYKNLYKMPNEEKAADMIFQAEKLFGKMTQSGFNKDSINLVLNGDKGGFAGVLNVISKFEGTAAGNRAHYIAGACYLHGKDFNNAVKHLKDFNTNATQVQTVAYLMLGDAFAELNKKDEAMDYYKKAAAVNTNDEFMTSEALYKSASYAEATGKTQDAISLYQKVKDEYPKSVRVNDIDKSLARLGVVK